jgi:hypothetical protein
MKHTGSLPLEQANRVSAISSRISSCQVRHGSEEPSRSCQAGKMEVKVDRRNFKGINPLPMIRKFQSKQQNVRANKKCASRRLSCSFLLASARLPMCTPAASGPI